VLAGAGARRVDLERTLEFLDGLVELARLRRLTPSRSRDSARDAKREKRAGAAWYWK
jgi:hypothetical protein